ncbi:hypothetical protein D8T49_13925 [Vibrio vulnificus]|nr:hypothetical protein D8T37_13720 [Vibrio vulnificus]RZQ13354.1 hypothetical protein D8T46_14915 [Vibrio vulnificus]RZQ48321.1 hypothetical protein D8T49_13925 [Vibrio vulnificus]HAS8169356.1 hypothetical protein [Vibrio vulnificus]HAS8214626.1 hypothetical protein [Vibrio vulnificus]
MFHIEHEGNSWFRNERRQEKHPPAPNIHKNCYLIFINEFTHEKPDLMKIILEVISKNRGEVFESNINKYSEKKN